MMNKALEAFGDLRDDEELGPADWPTVKKYITCLSNLEEERSHPHDVPEGDLNLHNISLRDIRVRLLNGTAVKTLSFDVLHIYLLLNCMHCPLDVSEYFSPNLVVSLLLFFCC